MHASNGKTIVALGEASSIMTGFPSHGDYGAVHHVKVLDINNKILN
jgi:hypothetical protein